MKRSPSFARQALAVVAGALFFAIAGCSAPAASPRAASPSTPAKTTYKPITTQGENGNLLLGNPSRAGRDNNNLLLVREAHAMSYNASGGGPNWVSWHLDTGDLGKATRSNFLPDPLLPSALQIRPNDYRGSGYDRGHVCPSGDRTRDSALNQQTFVMSNMLPQAPALNQQVWKDLEDYERYLVRDRNEELYVIAGGQGSAERIASGKVNVPAVCWKIIVVLPRGSGDLQRITASTRVIAVSMPNRERQEIKDSKWTEWITTVSQLEKTTGYDFLSALPDGVERALEQQRDSGRAAKADTASGATTAVAQKSSATAARVVSRHVREREPQGNWQSASPAPDLASREPPRRRSTNALQTNGRPERIDQQATSERQSAPEQQVAATGQVWVNTNSGVYHYAGARWYGTTKQGEYMSEAQAQASGYRAAQNGQ